METVKKVLSSIFICLMSVFLMSHNVSAAITPGSFIPDTAIGVFNVALENNFDGAHACNENITTGQPLYTSMIYTNLNMTNLAAGRDYLFSFTFFNSQNNNSFDGKIPVTIKSYIDDVILVKEVDVYNSSPSQVTVNMIVESVLPYNTNVWFSSSDSFILFPNECVSNKGFFTRIEWTGVRDYRTQLQNISDALDGLSDSMPSQQSINNINNSVQELNEAVEERNEQEQEAYDNISNQDPDDLKGDTDNQASTNLIGLFQSFITALSNITQANNCNLTLNFPSYAGGSVTVNVCQYKDKGGNLISIFSSLTLIVFYIPLALKLLSIIYNEIRSFTNG